MSDLLFPVIDPPEPIEDSGLYDMQYHPSVTWDWEKGDFARDGSNRMTACSGQQAYRDWCLKACMTERYSCKAYEPAIGTEMEAALREPTHEAVKSAIERTITEALLVNPRTEYVRNFTFDVEADQMWCGFAVKGIDWEEFSLRIRLEGGEESG